MNEEKCPNCGGNLSLWFSDYKTRMVRGCRAFCGYKEIRTLRSMLFDDDGQLHSIYNIDTWFRTHYDDFSLISHDEMILQIIGASKQPLMKIEKVEK